MSRRANPLVSPFACVLLFFAASLGPLSGCGPFGYIGKVSQKSVSAFEKAKQAEAETYAPYEYWAAKAYLDRARVMMTYSEYERAFDYGSRAEQLAEAAVRKAQRVKEQEATRRAQEPMELPPEQNGALVAPADSSSQGQPPPRPSVPAKNAPIPATKGPRR